MSASEDRFQELATAWALDALSPEEAVELRAILDQDATRLDELRELENAALHLPLLFETVEPAPGLRARIVGAAATDRLEAGGDWRSRIARSIFLDRPRVALTTVAALLATLLGLTVHTVRLHRAVDSERRTVVDLSDALAERERLLQILESADIDLVLLDGLDEQPRAHGKVIWDPEKHVALLQISNLPRLPEGETYQFWVFPKEGVPTSAGLFAVELSDRETFLRLDNFPAGAREALRGFLVTREPQGGTSEPGDNWYLSARLP